jgi:lipopolysaccharide transport system ATP-binding protein
MSEPSAAIRVEHLGKRYALGRQNPGEYQYTALRDVLTDAARSVGRRALRPRSGAPAEKRPEFWALRDLSLEVRSGEVLGIIGRNGAGKSTLLKLLSRITEPTEGRIVLNGVVGSLLEVGTGFHPELSGRENIFMNGAILGMARTEIIRQFDAIVAFAEVEKFLDTPVKRYSSGMYVRLAFAVAAHLSPDILIVDEVLAVGDAEFQRKCMGKMKDVATGGRTVLFVSHNMAAIEQLCPRTILLASGSLTDDGPTQQVVSRYLSEGSLTGGGRYDLTDHPARSGKFKPIIRHVELRNGEGAVTAEFFPDERFTAAITVETPAPIKEPRVALAVEDYHGRRIFTVASYLYNEELPTISGRCMVECTIPELRLGAGQYLASFSIGDKYHGLLDSINCAVWFEIAWRNNYLNGEPYEPVYGPVLAQGSWALIESPQEPTILAG